MSTTRRDGRLPKTLMVGSIAVGLAAGSYGVASAASGDSGTGPSTSSGWPAPARAPAWRLRIGSCIPTS